MRERHVGARLELRYQHAGFAAGAAAVAHGASVGASPVVAAVPTKLTTRTISLDVNTVLGDLLTLSYRERGELVLAS